MKILDIEDIKSSEQGFVATLGFFDGVHIGHRYLIEQVKDKAKKRHLPSLIITFPVHPRQVLNADFQPALLCGYDEKIRRLSDMQVDYCYPLDFTPQLSMMSAKQFMQDVLKEQLNVDTLVIGYDHRFGYNRNDGFEEYEKYGKKIGIDVVLASELDSVRNVSSSEIRRLLSEGDVLNANRLLSYNYSISGKIIEGFQIGRTIGFPTANIRLWEKYKVVPAYGIYAVYAYVDGVRYAGMLYIGNRPTLENSETMSIEVNLFDFDEDIYNKELTVEFVDFVRHDQKFNSLSELKESIQKDKKIVQNIFSNRGV